MEMGRGKRLGAFSWTSEVRSIALSALACSFILFCLTSGARGQASQDTQDAQQPKATDAEYRKFDDLVSFLRTRNAKQYAIPSPKGIDYSTSRSAASNSGSRFAGGTVITRCCCSCMAGRET